MSGRLLRHDLITIWKIFHSADEVGLSGVFDFAWDVGKEGHNFILTSPGWRTDMGGRTFGVRVVIHLSLHQSILVEANTFTAFKNRLYREVGVKLF